MRLMETLFSKKHWELLPEGFPAELIEGCLVHEAAPAYGHQAVAARIRVKLLGLLGPDLVPDTPVDVLLDDHNIFEPDIVVLRERPAPDAQYVGIPLLVVEVLSPSTAQRDRTVKRDKLLAAGVAEVWLVDTASRTVEIHEAGEVRRFEQRQPARSRALDGFELIPALLFTD